MQIELNDHSQQTIIKWFKNDKEIISNKKNKILTEKYVSTLCINNLQQSDSGKYVCAAKSTVGLVKSSCIINIIGRI